MLEVEDHADDVEHFQDYPDASDTENLEDRQPAQQSTRSHSEGDGQEDRSSSSSSEEEEKTDAAESGDVAPSTSGRGRGSEAKGGPQGQEGPGVALMGGYDMRKRYAEDRRVNTHAHQAN